ncbi:MAG: MbnH family di-heme enzyme [Myxococcota bacterium]
MEEPWVWNLPQGFPVPVVPADNPMTVAKVELGRQLFFDPILSLSRNQSCGSCHEPARAFTDGRALSEGSTGELTRRNSMSLANVAYNATLNWADPNMTRLEEQARGPLFGTEPVELGMGGREVELLDRLRDDPEYAEAFPLAFPNGEAFTVERLLAALASYQRSLISGGSPYDRFIAGDSELSEAARRGLELFFGERFECFHCHGGFNFTQSNRHEGAPDGEAPFHNTGLYNVDGRGAYPERDQGLIEVTGQPEDMGRFRAPTLRNVMVTAP